MVGWLEGLVLVFLGGVGGGVMWGGVMWGGGDVGRPMGAAGTPGWWMRKHGACEGRGSISLARHEAGTLTDGSARIGAPRGTAGMAGPRRS